MTFYKHLSMSECVCSSLGCLIFWSGYLNEEEDLWDKLQLGSDVKCYILFHIFCENCEYDI